MLELVRCANCSRSGTFKINLVVTYESKNCECCHRLERKTWDYHFCNLSCQMEWIEQKEIVTKGLECQNCRSTGFAFGYESNGICQTCDGIRRVKI